MLASRPGDVAWKDLVAATRPGVKMPYIFPPPSTPFISVEPDVVKGSPQAAHGRRSADGRLARTLQESA